MARLIAGRFLGIFLGLLVVTALPLRPQQHTLREIVLELFPIPAPTGYEQSLSEAILDLLPNSAVSTRDNLGSLYLHSLGETQRLTLITGMDDMGYVVSGITEEGYLALDRGISPPHRFYDTYQFGHHVKVWTRQGPLEGVWSLPSAHTLSSQRRRSLMQELTIAHAQIDIGAASRQQVLEKGVSYLDPVTPAAYLHELAGNQLSGPSLGTKLNTALLANLAAECREGIPLSQGIQFVWLAQSRLLQRRRGQVSAAGAVRAAKLIPSPAVVVVDIFPCAESSSVNTAVSPGLGPVLIKAGEESAIYQRFLAEAEAADIPIQEAQGPIPAMMTPFLEDREAVAVLLPVRFAYTPSEVVRLSDAELLQRLLREVMQGGGDR